MFLASRTAWRGRGGFDDVRSVHGEVGQTALNVLHIATPPLDVDGEYGPLTTDAVKNFQGANGNGGLDGWAGDKTQEKLQQAVAGH